MTIFIGHNSLPRLEVFFEKKNKIIIIHILVKTIAHALHWALNKKKKKIDTHRIKWFFT